MYNKNTCEKTMYGVVIENQFWVQFNTKKKRTAFLKKLGSRVVTCISNVSYPWNLEDGVHNLKTPQEFAKIYGCDTARVLRAIKNRKFKCESLTGVQYIVEKDGYYTINGASYRIKGKE